MALLSRNDLIQGLSYDILIQGLSYDMVMDVTQAQLWGVCRDIIIDSHIAAQPVS